jgi:hypothetical protein
LVYINFKFALFRKVNHRQRHDKGTSVFQKLGDEVKIAFEIGGVNRCDDHVRLRKIRNPSRHDVARNLLVNGRGIKAVKPRQIYQACRLGVMRERPSAFLALHSDAWVIGYLLAKSRQRIEQRGLARVWISRQRY